MKKEIIYILGLSIFLLFTISCKNDAPTAESSTASTQKTHPALNSKEGSTSAKSTHANASHLNTGGMKWMTFEDVAKHTNKEGKKYLVDVYTEWCGWCKVMDKKTFTDPEIQKFLDENFHIVKFDAEQKTSISFKGVFYDYVPAGKKGINKLAIELLGPRMSYPTLVYLDENLNLIKRVPGFKKPEQLMADLKLIVGS